MRNNWQKLKPYIHGSLTVALLFLFVFQPTPSQRVGAAASPVVLAYGTTVTMTQTSLDGVASSTANGWESDAIDNTAAVTTYCPSQCLDFRIAGKLQVESASVAAGTISICLIGELSGSTWPDVFDGTESTESPTDTEITDGICRPATTIINDAGASDTYYFEIPSAAATFGGLLPRKFVVFIRQATGTTLETTGDPNQVYVTGVYANVGT